MTEKRLMDDENDCDDDEVLDQMMAKAESLYAQLNMDQQISIAVRCFGATNLTSLKEGESPLSLLKFEMDDDDEDFDAFFDQQVFWFSVLIEFIQLAEDMVVNKKEKPDLKHIFKTNIMREVGLRFPPPTDEIEPLNFRDKFLFKKVARQHLSSRDTYISLRKEFDMKQTWKEVGKIGFVKTADTKRAVKKVALEFDKKNIKQ